MAEVQLGISTVMFGEEIEIDGTGTTLAPHDVVILRTIIDGKTTGTVLLSPAQAMNVAQQISAAAGRLANATVDDSGRKLSALARLALLTKDS